MFLAAVNKEFKLVFRDVHSILVLFVMPAIFILIMSLALQNQFGANKTVRTIIFYSLGDSTEYSEKFVALLVENEHLSFQKIPPISQSQAINKTLDDKSQVYLAIPPHLVDQFQTSLDNVPPIKLWFSPSLDERTRLLVESAVYGALVKTKLYFSYTPNLSSNEKSGEFIAKTAIHSSFIRDQTTTHKTPTAVQQNVPAWLVFSMFFVVIPLSTTLITERQQGTLNRLRTMHVPLWAFLLSKALPYLLINQIQMIIMVLLGAYAVPLLGGDKLDIPQNFFALASLSLAVGFSAIGYALLIAVIAKTTEQAVSLGGVGNILLGALGGIMVPTFVMPAYLQQVTQISPMSWGLDGFLDIFLYGYGIIAIMPEILMLVAFGTAMATLAMIIFYKRL